MSNNTTKVNNPMKVITGKDIRWSYANVWEAKSINGGAPKFSVSLIIPKSDTVTVQKIKAAVEAAYHEGEAKLKGNGKSVPALSVIKNPLRDGDTERPDDPAYAGCYVTRYVPSFFGFLGAGKPDYCPLHNSRTIIDEDVLAYGAAVLANCAIEWLNAHK